MGRDDFDTSYTALYRGRFTFSVTTRVADYQQEKSCSRMSATAPGRSLSVSVPDKRPIRVWEFDAKISPFALKQYPYLVVEQAKIIFNEGAAKAPARSLKIVERAVNDGSSRHRNIEDRVGQL
ncbi:MAG: hypothetical protein HC888_07140 [Candidatus Competibacteraceae bacterium]|nr:hypothetical protein [Candidatus Competibacteraceae bacterium]